jgi:hypothetical protein
MGRASNPLLGAEGGTEARRRILATGWPLSNIPADADAYTLQCLRIYDVVRQSGVPNFLHARIPLPHNLNMEAWSTYLQGYSDVSLVEFLTYGWPVGFDAHNPIETTFENHASACRYPTHVDAYIATEVSERAMVGPFRQPPFWPWVHVNPLMTREKKNSSQRRVILDLSWPHQASVNQGTPLDTYMGEAFKLRLPTTDDLASVIACLGRGAYLWGLDLSRCYRQWRADPLDWPLLGITWGGQYYVDVSIAFGLRHGASFAQRVSTAFCDILAQDSFNALSYIDDFLGAEATASQADQAFRRAIQLAGELGLQLAEDKSTPPTTAITWIGVLFDTVAMEMSIPPAVLVATRELVVEWSGRTRATRHDLQVLLGRLFHAAKCSPPARLFVGRMLHTLRQAPLQGTTPLSDSFRLDLQWFVEFLPTYNGVQFIIPDRPAAHLFVYTNPVTLRAVWEDNLVEGSLPEALRARNRLLASKEIFTIFVALQLWGEQWAGRELHVHSAASQRVVVLVHGRSRDLGVMHIARGIWLITARRDIVLKPRDNSEVFASSNNFDKCAIPATALDYLSDY